jgi:hypothetical protein
MSEALATKVKAWVEHDNRLRQLQHQVKTLRAQQKEHGESILAEVQEMKSLPRITISDGHLQFVETKSYSSLTFSFLFECFAKKFQNEEVAEQLIDFIKAERTLDSELDIKRVFK